METSTLGRPRRPMEERFWAKVDTSGRCWEWQGATNGAGYGYLWDGERVLRSHRLAYSLIHGEIPKGLLICHHCDNPACVKPSHLFLGTYSDNLKDAIAKDRWADRRGETNGNSRLVKNDVHEIRRLRSLGVKQALLAKMWKIDAGHISDIVLRKSWKHI